MDKLEGSGLGRVPNHYKSRVYTIYYFSCLLLIAQAFKRVVFKSFNNFSLKHKYIYIDINISLISSIFGVLFLKQIIFAKIIILKYQLKVSKQAKQKVIFQNVSYTFRNKLKHKGMFRNIYSRFRNLLNRNIYFETYTLYFET